MVVLHVVLFYHIFMDLHFKLALPKNPMSSDITDQSFLGALNDPSSHFGEDALKSLPEYPAALEVFRRLLRGYVDQWIDTGVSQDGSEDLTERGFYLHEWFVQRQLLPYADEKAGAVCTSSEVVLEVYRQNPQTVLAEDGLHIIFPTCVPKMENAPLNVLAEREAQRFFVWFLASRLRVKLGRCRRCQLYEIKTRKFYKRGTYCRRCKAKTSAGEVTQKKRRDLQRRRKEALAAVLKSRVGIDLNDLTMRKMLAEEVNWQLNGEPKISSKWVKRNLPDDRRQRPPSVKN
jgi:hypothetical protein